MRQSWETRVTSNVRLIGPADCAIRRVNTAVGSSPSTLCLKTSATRSCRSHGKRHPTGRRMRGEPALSDCRYFDYRAEASFSADEGTWRLKCCKPSAST